MLKSKKAIVIHSGGMDSSICLALAVKEHGKDSVLSLSFSYGQRHSIELDRAKKIAGKLGVEHFIVNVSCFSQITKSALLDSEQEMIHEYGKPPNTIVTGRNGFMLRMAAIYGEQLGATEIYMGIIEVEAANSGYRDCSREYADKMQDILRIDLGHDKLSIKTPLIFMTKYETMELAYKLGLLKYLLEETITCYKGIPNQGCETCPACLLRNEGISHFLKKHPDFEFSYKNRIVN